MAFDMVDVSRIYLRSYISIFKSLPAWEVLHLLCVSRASSWSLRGRWRFLRGVLLLAVGKAAVSVNFDRRVGAIFQGPGTGKVIQDLWHPQNHIKSQAGTDSDSVGIYCFAAGY